MTATVYLNGPGLPTISVAVSDLSAWKDLPSRKLDTTALPGRMGVLASRIQQQAREFAITGTVFPTSLLVTDRAAAEDQLLSLSAAGLLTIRLDDGQTTPRETKGYCTTVSVKTAGKAPPLRQVATDFTAKFSCPDATWEDVGPLPYGFGATRTPMPLGTAPVAPLLRLHGSATNPVLKYRNAAGDVIATITFTITLGSNDFLEVDCNTGRVTKSVAGTRTDDYAIYGATTANDNLPVLDPDDGRYLDSVWPTLEVSAGTGLALYAKRWR